MTAPIPRTWNTPAFPVGATTANPNWPVSMQVGDLVVMVIVLNSPLTPPAGWTVKVFNSTNAMAIAYHWVDGTEGATTGVWTMGAGYHLWSFLIRGAEPVGGDPFDGTPSVLYNLTAATPASSLTTAQADSLLLWVDCNFSGASIVTPPAGMVSWFVAADYVHVCYQTLLAAGATGNKQATESAAGQNHTFLFAIKGMVPEVIVAGAKKIITAQSVIVGGVKKPVVAQSVIVSGVKKPIA